MARPMRRHMFNALALLAVSLVTVGAQQPGEGTAPSTKGMVLKGKAPVSNDILKVKLPRPQEADLPNGVHLMVLEDHRLPQIAFQIIIPGAGGYYDDPSTIGLANYTAQLMREGTETRNSQQISQELERMAAFVNVGASVSGPNATVSGSAHDGELRSPVRAHRGDPARAVVPGRRMGSVEDAVESRPDPAASQPGLPRQRAVLTGDLRRPSRRTRVGHAGHARRHHARGDRRPSTARTTFPITPRSRSPATSRWPKPGKPWKPGSAAGRSAARRSRRSPIPRRSGPARSTWWRGPIPCRRRCSWERSR